MDPKKKTKVQADIIKAQKEAIQIVSKTTNIATISAIESQIFQDSARIVEEALGFADVSIDQDTGEIIPPDSWEFLPKEERDRKLRLAKMALMPSGDAPHGLKMAHATMIGIMKAQAAKDSGTKVLNIENAVFPSPSPLKDDIEVLDVDE